MHVCDSGAQIVDGGVKGLMVSLFAMTTFFAGIVLGADERAFLWITAIPGAPLLAMLMYWWGKSNGNGGSAKRGPICACGECVD